MERHNPTTTNSKKSAAFTLVELLVVISIIVILAGLSFPAVNGALDSAKKTHAKSNAVQIAAAVSAYDMEYGKLPTNSTGRVDADFMKILTGADTTYNSRSNVFLEAQAWKKGKGGTNSVGYCDPWSSNTPYSIALDNDNYDNSINAGTNSQSLRKKVGVWNVPSSHPDNPSPATQTKRYVTSWD